MTTLFSTPSATATASVTTALILPMLMLPPLLAHARALLGRRVIVAAEFRLRLDPSFLPAQAAVPFLLHCCTAAQEAITAMGHTDTGAETGPHTHMRVLHNRLTTLFCTPTAVRPPSK